MKALVMEAAGSAAVTEVGDPVAGDYEAAVEMVVCGVCNSTDRMLRTGTFAPGVSYPSILGHESVGRITAVGGQVRYLRPGQLVTRCSAYGWDDPPIRMYWGGLAERGVVRDTRAWLVLANAGSIISTSIRRETSNAKPFRPKSPWRRSLTSLSWCTLGEPSRTSLTSFEVRACRRVR